MLAPKEAARLSEAPTPAAAPGPGAVPLSLGDGLAVLLARTLPALAPPPGAPAPDASALSGAPPLLRGAEEDEQEACLAAAELLARLAAAPGALALLAAPARRLAAGGGGGGGGGDGGLVNFCLLGLLAPSVLGLKPSDSECRLGGGVPTRSAPGPSGCPCP
jgi:hypothetical protein